MNDKLIFIFIVFLLASLVISIAIQLNKAKKNDGVITKEEIQSIIMFYRDGICDILTKYIAVSDMPDVDKYDYIKEQFIEHVEKNPIMSDSEKVLITENMDTIIEFIVDNEKLIEQQALKVVEKEKQE